MPTFLGGRARSPKTNSVIPGMIRGGMRRRSPRAVARRSPHSSRVTSGHADLRPDHVERREDWSSEELSERPEARRGPWTAPLSQAVAWKTPYSGDEPRCSGLPVTVGDPADCATKQRAGTG
jgi:hypothetical protein